MRRIFVLMVAVLLVAACGNAAEEVAERAIEAGGGGDVDVEFDDDGETGEIVIESEDGSQTINVGDQDLPAELSIPMPDGFEVIASSVIEQGDEKFVTAVVSYPGGDIEEIAAHFDDYYDGIEGASRTQTSFEGGTQFVWLNEGGVGVTAVEREGENAVEVSVTEIQGS